MHSQEIFDVSGAFAVGFDLDMETGYGWLVKEARFVASMAMQQIKPGEKHLFELVQFRFGSREVGIFFQGHFKIGLGHFFIPLGQVGVAQAIVGIGRVGI